jgi:hypothetical protein
VGRVWRTEEGANILIHVLDMAMTLHALVTLHSTTTRMEDAWGCGSGRLFEWGSG